MSDDRLDDCWDDLKPKPEPVKSGANLKESAKSASFYALEPVDPNNKYRVWCPVCNLGILSASRDLGCPYLRRRNICSHCGQQFIWTDDSIAGEKFEDNYMTE
jgi:hypothetical protein